MKNEMKKVIPIPDGTERIEVYSYASVDEKGPDYPNGDAGFMIDNLPDAPEKCVIELPAELLSDFKDMLSAGSDNDHDYHVGKFLKSAIHLVNDWQVGHEKVLFNENDLADWYLGHVEFVEKKEPKFYVRVDVDGEEQSVAMWQNSDGESGIAFDVFMRNEPAYTETDADNLVAGLTALNARKVKVEE